MERREFVKMTALAGAAVITGTAEPVEASKATFDMDAFLAQTDRQLAGLGERRTLESLGPLLREPKTDAERAAARRTEELMQKSMRSLLLVGLLQDIPTEAQAHPGIQERIKAALPEMDDAVLGLMEFMSAMSPAERIDLQDAMAGDPDLPMRVMEGLDGEAKALGISLKRRTHMRRIGAQVSYRMRHQSPSAVMDEYVAKTEKVVAHHGGALVWEQRLAARAANEVFFTLRALSDSPLATAPAMGGVRIADATPSAPPPPPATTPLDADFPMPPPDASQAERDAYWRERVLRDRAAGQQPPTNADLDPAHKDPMLERRQKLAERQARRARGSYLMNVGGICMGVGIVAGGLFGLLAALSPGALIPALFGVTAGALLLLAGLIVIIVAAVKYWQNA